MSTESSSPNPLAFSCTCGAVQGHITPDGAKAGTHVACFCADCRANELYHDQPDPAPGPVHLLQVAPESLTFTKGAEHLQIMRLSPRGIFRWYAGCCGTPLANTLASPKLPFAGVRTSVFQDPEQFGKVRVQSFVPTTPGKPPQTKGALGMVFSLVKRMGTSLMSGGWRQSPFFDAETGKPAAPITVLTKEERDALTRQ